MGVEAVDDPTSPFVSGDSPIAAERDLAARSAEPWSLVTLYRQHGARLRSYFRKRGSAAVAEDLLQETFTRIATAKRRRADIVEPGAYLHQVARNLLREQARFAARRSVALHVSHEGLELAGADPVAQLEARDMLDRLEQAMTKMSPATREIFMAHRVYGHGYAEIAAASGRSVKSVEKHMSKAIFLVNRTLRRG